MSMIDALYNIAAGEITAQARRLETGLTEALAGTPPDLWNRLHIVHQDGWAPAVACAVPLTTIGCMVAEYEAEHGTITPAELEALWAQP